MEKQSSTSPMPSAPLLVYSRRSQLTAAHLDRHQKFTDLVKTLAPKFEQLLACPPLPYGKLPSTMPKVGRVFVYGRRTAHVRWTVQRAASTAWPPLSSGGYLQAGCVCVPACAGKDRADESCVQSWRRQSQGIDAEPGFRSGYPGSKSTNSSDGVPLRRRNGPDSAGFARDLLRRRARHAVQRLRDALNLAD